MQNLSVVSLNTWLLRIPFFGAKAVDWRRTQILRALLQQSPDIICLQEVWHERDIDYFDRHLGERGYHTIAARSGFFGSGLYIACRFHIERHAFLPNLAHASGPEHWITKGSQRLKLSIPFENNPPCSLILVNLHMGAEVARDDRAEDIKRSFEFALEGSDEHTNLIIAGDLAVDPFSDERLCLEYQSIIESFRFEDVVWPRNPGDFPTMLAHNPFVKAKWANQSIDYIFYRGPSLIRTVRAKYFADQPVKNQRGHSIFLSDHVGVMAQFELSPNQTPV